MSPIIPLLVIALGLTVLIALSALYFRSAKENANLVRLKMVAKTHFLGNTLALRPFQSRVIDDPRNWAEYDEALYEPETVREHIFWPCVLCIATVFAMASILFIAFELEYYQRPSMILGGALELGADARDCPGQSCPPHVQQAINVYQLGSLEVVQFSFLAAYVWALWQLFYRMVTRDVTVYAFHVITIRVITTAILALTLYQLFSGVAPVDPEALASAVAQPQEAEAAVTAASPTEAIEPQFTTFDTFILMAFAIGFFPEVALRWLSARARRFFQMGEQSSYLDVEAIEGIDTFTRARLAEAGIVEATHLAASNPVTLALRTPFALQQLVDWAGQAQLLVLLKHDRYNHLREQGIRTSFQFYNQFSGGAAGPGPATIPGPLGVDVTSACASLNADPSFRRLKEMVEKMMA